MGSLGMLSGGSGSLGILSVLKDDVDFESKLGDV